VPAAKAAAAAGSSATAGAAAASDGAGQALFEKRCADCHEPADFSGQSAPELEATLAGIAAGKVKHKGKLDVTPAESKLVAQWLATVR
jgi:mono/diheme cytochrome c family protein